MGYVDRIADNIAWGWVDCGGLDNCQVEVRSHGTTIASATPNVPRRDLAMAGLDNAFGFYVSLPLNRLDVGDNQIQFVVTSKGVDIAELRDALTDSTTLSVWVEKRSHWVDGLPDLVRDRLLDNPAIARELVADPRIAYRPAQWTGDFIFIDGTGGSESARYRVENIRDGLSKMGKKVVALGASDIWCVMDGSYTAPIIVFFRCGFDGLYKSAFDAVKCFGSTVIYDIDDYIFDLSIRENIDGLKYLTKDKLSDFEEAAESSAAFIRCADIVTVSTTPLRLFASRLASRVEVYRNSITPSYEAMEARRPRPKNLEKITIGYYSGSLTHQADFRVASDGLAKVMRNQPCVHLRLVGEFETGEFPWMKSMAARITTVDKMSHRDMMEDLRHCDLVMAPLEIGNPFCEAKSQLKYFEAALLGIACIASATEPFRQAISPGVNGYLVDAPSSWEAVIQNAVKDLVTAPISASELRAAALSEFGADRAAKEFLAAVGHQPP